MKEEFIIINKTAVQKRIEEIIVEQQNTIKKLKELYDSLKHSNKYFDYKDNISRYFTSLTNEKRFIEKTLSQSVPLIPVLQKTWNTAYIDAMSIDEETYKPLFFEDYIANLKLNI